MDDCTSRADDQPAPTTEAVADHLWEMRHQTLYRSQLSAQYHRRRERFYDWLHRSSLAVALFSGSAAFAAAAHPALVQTAGALVALATLVALVFGFSDKARLHAQLAEQFKRIEAEVYRAGDYDYTEAQINEWRARIAHAEAQEPPMLRPLVVLCQNDLAVSAGQYGRVRPLPLHQRVLAHFVDFDTSIARADNPQARPS